MGGLIARLLTDSTITSLTARVAELETALEVGRAMERVRNDATVRANSLARTYWEQIPASIRPHFVQAPTGI